jgi:hypothetical protein
MNVNIEAINKIILNTFDPLINKKTKKFKEKSAGKNQIIDFVESQLPINNFAKKTFVFSKNIILCSYKNQNT